VQSHSKPDWGHLERNERWSVAFLPADRKPHQTARRQR
jgi:hypothetical protein